LDKVHFIQATNLRKLFWTNTRL